MGKSIKANDDNRTDRKIPRNNVDYGMIVSGQGIMLLAYLHWQLKTKQVPCWISDSWICVQVLLLLFIGTRNLLLKHADMKAADHFLSIAYGLIIGLAVCYYVYTWL